MSFMFKPYDYDDLTAINRPQLTAQTVESIVAGTDAVNRFIAGLPKRYFAEHRDASAMVLALDGYVDAHWKATLDFLAGRPKDGNITVRLVNLEDYYRPSPELEMLLAECLPIDEQKDPIALFGRLYEGAIQDLFDTARLAQLCADLCKARSGHGGADGTREVIVLHGCGAAAPALRALIDAIVYFDIAPMPLALRVVKGEVRNIGDQKERTRAYIFRRLYYVDFEVSVKHRQQLLQENLVDYYVDGNRADNLKLMPRAALNEIFAALVQYPFRCKPCYIEGVWGGEYIRKIRHLPAGMQNCAWVFDIIPNEVSLAVAAGDNLLEFPFVTFFRKEGKALLGAECVQRFNGCFPIRFNYDDTFHGMGNMSIQVHPDLDYCTKNFNESVQQDESYYVVAAGHNAKTYIGLKDEADPDEFFRQARQSEETHQPVDYERYINAEPSCVGKQFMLPAGTVHSSGRNQVVLEIGSCTVGSYTFKLYDYVRLDLNGKPRPIHTWHGRNVLRTERKAAWVRQNLISAPRLVRQGERWAEYIVGEYEKTFFSLRRLEFEDEMPDDTGGRFHVLVLVDGEKVRVQSLANPDRFYEMAYLEMVVVPACLGKYVIRNLGRQPVVMHKTCLI